MTSFLPGSRVRISGLVSRADLNNTIGVVLSPESDVERVNLAARGRVKITGYPTQLSIKESNLSLVHDNHRIDWSYQDVGNTSRSISDLIQLTDVGSMDVCHEFVRVVMNEACNNDSVSLRMLEERTVPLTNQACTFMYNTTFQHCMYFFKLDKIAHHLVIETYEGKARLFQSLVRDDNGLFEVGYTAKEWGSEHTQSKWSSMMISSHKKYGGARTKELSWDEFNQVLLDLLQIRDTANEVVRYILTQGSSRGGLPSDVMSKFKIWVNIAMTNSSQIDMTTSPIYTWCDKVLNSISCVSMTQAPDGSAYISSGPLYLDKSIGEENFTIHIPNTFASKLHSLFGSITGCPPPVYMYLRMIMYSHFMSETNDSIGWNFCCASIPH